MLRRDFLAAGAFAAAAMRRPAKADSLAIELSAQPDYRFNRALIEALPGDKVQIQFTNALPETTNLHFHGLHVSPRVDDSMLRIPPNETHLYELEIPADHPAGTFWFHPHVHGRTAAQVGRGLAGAFLIRGGLDDIPEIAGMAQRVWLLQDNPLEASPTFQIEQNGWLRLRVVNASRSSYYNLQIQRHMLYLIAMDGGALPKPLAVASYRLPPGGRVDFCVRGDQPPGAYTILNDRFAELASLAYSGTAADTAELPAVLIGTESLPAPSTLRTFTLGGSGMGPGMMGGAMGNMGMFTINARSFDPNRIDTTVMLGVVEDWEFVNETGMDHPMHVHTNPFQVLDSAGQPIPVWRDVVNVPARSRVRVRTQFRDFTGMSMYHCHILEHEDAGMMATLMIGP